MQIALPCSKKLDRSETVSDYAETRKEQMMIYTNSYVFFCSKKMCVCFSMDNKHKN